jgi:hypothetical protein
MTTLTIDDESEELSAVDRDALERAIEICRTKKGPAVREQTDDMLKTRPWLDAASFAAYSCQCDALHLKPWQSPPVWIEDLVGDIQAGPDGVGGQHAAARLLRRMLDAGLSRYEPDPLGALKRAKGRPPDQPPPV